ncbi:proactivator polypeptide-like 1 isoform X2 [Neltuma alba]|uniref:proactivator polypeptide-like 1 isoform X2 n=1 Tax=Neltuma alba TaxID=207710 RepID=UPI0010A2CA63|nr:proactivator polypeptide-like 1 isoform X2 [Prosopis alba]
MDVFTLPQCVAQINVILVLTKSNMEERTGLLFLVVLSAAWICDAREMANPGLWRNNTAKSDSSELAKKKDVCALCEEYTSEALDFLTKKETQDEIIDILYHTCQKLRPLEQECLNLVDLYAPPFFSKLASLQPGELCKKANLCQRIAKVSSQVQEDSCGFCRDAVSEVLVKLKDPDTELDVIETLLKACNSIEKYAQKCKRLVFAYGPVMLFKAEKFLERTDICTALRACKASTIDMEAKDMKETPLLSDF